MKWVVWLLMLAGAAASRAGEPEFSRFVVDSEFFDNGQPAVGMPLENWLAGDGPHVKEHQDER